MSISENLVYTGDYDRAAGLPEPGSEVVLDVEDMPGEGELIVENEDGSVTIQFGEEVEGDSDDHDVNLALFMSEGDLNLIAMDILEGIEEDDRSRQEWLNDRARGLQLLGLKLEEPRADTGSASAPLEGMSTVRHPLLLEAVLRFQANARGEMLPAAGPVKAANYGSGTGAQDKLAEELERKFNYFLTSVAKEFYPDTDRMHFYVGFGGCGFKKVYTDPILRRPASLSVDANDLIVNNTATDFASAQRATQRSYMKPSTLRRMQLLGVYRDVELGTPIIEFDAVDQEQQTIEGVNGLIQREKDQLYTIYECYCELDLPGFEHVDEDGDPTGLQLPYKVTIDKDSQQILEIRRNWAADDEMKLPETHFVKYGFIDAIGFYSIGLLHILGNTTNALTGAWRMYLDACMFGNFPGFLYSDAAGRQVTNDMRIAPGTGQRIQTGSMPIGSVVMPLPYRTPDTAAVQFVETVAATGQRVGNTAEIAVGEGRADVPVGTTLAMIEQATKILDAVHKRMHAAQAEEFALLKREFQKDPEALWRHRNGKDKPDDVELFIQALNDFDLVPVSDPNIPSHTHRIMKAMALQTVASAQQNVGLFDTKAVATRILTMMGVPDAQSLFAPPKPAPMNPDFMLRAQELQLKDQKQQVDAAAKMKELELRSAELENERKKIDLEMNAERARLAAEVVGWANEVNVKREIAHMKSQETEQARVQNMMDSAATRQHSASEAERARMHQANEGEKSRQERVFSSLANRAQPGGTK